MESTEERERKGMREKEGAKGEGTQSGEAGGPVRDIPDTHGQIWGKKPARSTRISLLA